MKNQTQLVAGIPVAPELLKLGGLVSYQPAPGAGKATCDFCHETEMWLGPRQLKWRTEETGVKVICPFCIRKYFRGEMPDILHLGGKGSVAVLKDGTVLK